MSWSSRRAHLRPTVLCRNPGFEKVGRSPDYILSMLLKRLVFQEPGLGLRIAVETAVLPARARRREVGDQRLEAGRRHRLVHDLAVPDEDDSIRPRRQLRVVVTTTAATPRWQATRTIRITASAFRRVERARGLVREQQRPLADDRPRESRPVAFPTGELSSGSGLARSARPSSSRAACRRDAPSWPRYRPGSSGNRRSPRR